RGLRLEQIAAETKIAKHHLEALESGRFDSLPGGVYRGSFLRQYARLLELDENEMVVSLHERYQEPPLPLPKPPHVKRRTWPLNLVWLPTAAAALFGIHHLWKVESNAQLQRPANKASVATAPAPAGHAERLQEEPKPAATESAATPEESAEVRVSL